MNVAIIGYGKLGKEIERLASEYRITIAKVFRSEDNPGGKGLTNKSLAGIDVCIDVSTPQAVMANIHAVAKCKKNIVVGTTGWYDELNKVSRMVKRSNIGLLYASNFSIGMNIFFQGVDLMASLCDKVQLYDVGIMETHHTQKLDAPSATALTLAETILKNSRSKSAMLSESPKGKIKPGQLQVASIRLGSVVGNHRVVFDSEADTIEFTHNAKNRSGFARGALLAANWLKGKKGLFIMKDVITSL